MKPLGSCQGQNAISCVFSVTWAETQGRGRALSGPRREARSARGSPLAAVGNASRRARGERPSTSPEREPHEARAPSPYNPAMRDYAAPKTWPPSIPRRTSASRRVSLHARHSADDVSRAAVDDAAVCGLRHRRRVERAVSLLAVARRQRPERGVRPPHPDRLRLRSPPGGRRSGPRRRGDRLDRRHGDAVRGHSARQGVDLDDDQRDGDHPARALRRGRQAAGRGPEAVVGHRAERHPQGIHRARHLHLSAAGVPPHRHRHLRVLRARGAAVEHDFDQRVSHPRSGIDRGAGSGVHVRQRDCLRAGGDRCGTRRQFLRPAAVVLFQRAQRFSRGDCEVPGGAAPVGADDERAVRRDPPARAAAALPHADRREHAHRPATRQQHRARRHSGAVGGARRHPVAAHQRARRGAGAADRRRGAHCAAHAADHRPRVGRGQHDRSDRGLVSPGDA